MGTVSAQIERHRIGLLGLSFALLSVFFVATGPMTVPPQTWVILLFAFSAAWLLLSLILRSVLRAAVPVLAVVTSLGVVHVVSSFIGLSPVAVKALFFLTLIASGAAAIYATVAVMTNVARSAVCRADALPLGQIARYGLAAFLAGLVALGDIFFLGDRPLVEIISFVAIALAAPLIGFGLFFIPGIEKTPAGEAAAAHDNRWLGRAEVFERVGRMAQIERAGRALLLFMVPPLALLFVAFKGGANLGGYAAELLIVISGFVGVALFYGKSFRSAFVTGLAFVMFAAVPVFVIGALNLPRPIGLDIFAGLSAAMAVLLPPAVTLYQECEARLLKGVAMRTALVTSAARSGRLFALTAALFGIGAIPWIVGAPVSAGSFAALFAAFLIPGAFLVPLFVLALFAITETLFVRRALIKWTV